MPDSKISQLANVTTPLAGTEVLPIVQSSATKKVSVENVLTSIQPSGIANAIAYLNASKQLTYNAKYTFDGTSFQTLLNPTYVNGGYKSTRDSLSGGVYNTFDFIEGTTTAGYLRNYGSVFGSGRDSQIHLWNTQNAHVVIGVNNTAAGSFTTNGLAFPSGKGIDFSANASAAGMTSELLNDYEEGTWTPTIGGNFGGDTGQVYATRVGYYTKVGNVVTCYFKVVFSAKGTMNGGAVGLIGFPFTSKSGSLAFTLATANLTDGSLVNKAYNGAGTGFNYFPFGPSNVTDTSEFEGTVSYQAAV